MAGLYDSCRRCRHWRPPERSFQKMGTCRLDRKLSHPGYCCGRFQAHQADDTLELTEAEIAWIRAHRYTRVAERLIRLYRLVVDQVPGAKTSFGIALTEWRHDRNPRTFRNPSSGSAGNEAGTEEGRSHATQPSSGRPPTT